MSLVRAAAFAGSGTQELFARTRILATRSRLAGRFKPYICLFLFGFFLRSAFAVFSSFSEIDTAQRSYRVDLSIGLCIENPTAHTKVQSHSIKSENGPRSEKENRAAWAVNCGPFAGPMKADIVRVSLDPCYSVPADPNHFWAPYGAASSFRAYPDSCTVARICLH